MVAGGAKKVLTGSTQNFGSVRLRLLRWHAGHLLHELALQHLHFSLLAAGLLRALHLLVLLVNEGCVVREVGWRLVGLLGGRRRLLGLQTRGGALQMLHVVVLHLRAELLVRVRAFLRICQQRLLLGCQIEGRGLAVELGRVWWLAYAEELGVLGGFGQADLRLHVLLLLGHVVLRGARKEAHGRRLHVLDGGLLRKLWLLLLL